MHRFPRSFAPSLLSPFTNHRDYSGTIIVAPTTGLIYLYIWYISPLKAGSQDQAFRIQGDLFSHPLLHPVFSLERIQRIAPQIPCSVPFLCLLQFARNPVVIFLQPHHRAKPKLRSLIFSFPFEDISFVGT